MMGEWGSQKLEIRKSKLEKSLNEEKTKSSKRPILILGLFSFELFTDFGFQISNSVTTFHLPRDFVVPP